MVPGHCSQRCTEEQNRIPFHSFISWRNQYLTSSHKLDLICLKACLGGMTCSFFSPGLLIPLPTAVRVTQLPLGLVLLTSLSCVTFLFLHVFQLFCHNLCELLTLFRALFGVKSSYFSYSDSSNSLNHVEVL